MSIVLTTESEIRQNAVIASRAGGFLQRKCACGNHTVAGGKCTECGKKEKEHTLQRDTPNREKSAINTSLSHTSAIQRKLTIGASDDPLEQEADRIANQVLSMPANPAVVSAPPRIQRFTQQPTGGANAAPVGVDRVLDSPGRPLEPALRQDMEQRFGHDFSCVRVHSDRAARQSSSDINANAYTVGHNIVFGTGRFAPGTHEGRRLIAHELTHVIQQSFGGAHALQRDEQKQGIEAGGRVDVALVLDDDPTAMTEARTYASTVIRATSGADAKTQLLALGKPIGTIFVVSHSNRLGEVQVISEIGTISWVKLSDLSKDLKGMPRDKAPQDIDFRGCKLGEAPEEMENFRRNVGAQSARATNCWSMATTVDPLTLPDGTPITQKSQIKGIEKKFGAALRKQINGLKTNDKVSVKDCIIGLGAGEKADKNLAKIKTLYFQNGGNLAAGWASPEFNYDWQRDSICFKDMTATTSPCKIVTKTASAKSGGTKKGGNVP